MSNMGHKEINIVIDTRALLGGGGVPQYTRHLIKNLESEGKIFYLFCSSLRQLHNLKSRFLKVFFRIPSKLFNLSLLIFGWPKIDKMVERRLGKNIDLFFLPNINFWQSEKVKTVIVSHDLSYAISPKFFMLRDRLWHRLINPQKLYAKADFIIAVSQNTKKDLVSLYKISADKIKVIYPGASIDAAELQNRKGNYILFLANLEPRKNVLTLIDAFEKVESEIDLVIAGGGKYRRIVERRRMASYKRDKIKLTGFVKESDKAKLIYEARVFIYPSFYEGFGFPPLEAQILGVPVIASLTSSLGEILGDSALLINPYNTTELAKAIDLVLENKDLEERLREKGWENVKRFSWTKTAEEVGIIINELIGSR